MALAIDSGPTSGTAGSGGTHNVTFVNTAGTIIYGMAGFDGGSSDNITSMKYNAVSMTQRVVGTTGATFFKRAWIYELKTPATGSNTMATVYNAAFDEENETAISFTGQDGTTPSVTLGNVTTTTTSLAMDFSSMSAGDIGLMMASIGNAAGAALTGAAISGGATLNSSYSGAFNGTTFWAAKVTAAGTCTMSWTGNFEGIAVGLIVTQAAAAGGTGWGAPFIAGKRNHLVRVA